MGACFNTVFIPFESDADTTANVQKKWDAMVDECLYMNGHSYSGGIGMLGHGFKDEISSKFFDSIEQATEYICDNTKKYGKALAVRVCKSEQQGVLIGGWCAE